jgi:hypothetical protein
MLMPDTSWKEIGMAMRFGERDVGFRSQLPSCLAEQCGNMSDMLYDVMCPWSARLMTVFCTGKGD